MEYRRGLINQACHGQTRIGSLWLEKSRAASARAKIKPELSYDRMVAECFLPDGRDLAAELVRVGLALDWPKFSGIGTWSRKMPDASSGAPRLANAACCERTTSQQGGSWW
jgi:endonuclease YncB( thermonuclease family)